MIPDLILGVLKEISPYCWSMSYTSSKPAREESDVPPPPSVKEPRHIITRRVLKIAPLTCHIPRSRILSNLVKHVPTCRGSNIEHL